MLREREGTAIFKMGNKNFYFEVKGLRALKQKLLTIYIKSEPTCGTSAQSLNGRCLANRGFI